MTTGPQFHARQSREGHAPFLAILVGLAGLAGCSNSPQPVDSGQDAGDIGSDQGTDAVIDSTLPDVPPDVRDDLREAGGPDIVDAGDASSAVRMNYTRNCDTSADSIRPAEGEEQHWIALRVTPPAWPFEVTRIRYVMVGQPTEMCDATLGHRVVLFTYDRVPPPATPTILATVDVPADPAATTSRVVNLDIFPPLRVTGEADLYVSIQNALSGTHYTCFQSCPGVTGTENRNWWSNAAAAPFPWATLASFGIGYTYNITVEGHVAAR